MKNIIRLLFVGAGMLAICQGAWAAGSAYKAESFATTGAAPQLFIVVTDPNGIGCGGIPVNISVTTGAGIPSLTSATTGPDGTTRVAVTDSVLGTIINVYCSQVTTGNSNSIIASAARAVAATDRVIGWFDEPRHTVYAAVVDPNSRVMVTTTSGSIDDEDILSTDADTKRLTFGQIIMQDPTAYPYERGVYQGTYDTTNTITINVDDITGTIDATLSLSTLAAFPNNRLLKAFATGGTNPKIVAVVIDREGRGVEGITINVQSYGGSMTPVSAATDDRGIATFYQSGGSLGNTIVVSSSLANAMPVSIITQDSLAMSANSEIFSWYEKKTRMIFTAVTERATHVLVQSTVDLRRDVSELSADSVYPYPGDFIEQTSATPGSSYVVYGGSEAGDLIRIYHYGTLWRYPGGATYNSGIYGNSVITLPANEAQYLMACAAPGTEPYVWAMVVDSNGNAVKNAPLVYSMQGSGSLDLGNTTTVWSGLSINKVSGGSLGNTITVTSPGLGIARIYLSNARTASSVDRAYGLYDPETHMLYGALVQPENNIMTSAFNQDTFLGYDELDQTAGNGVAASVSYYLHPQSDIKLCQGYAGFGTIGAGDIIRLRSTYITPTYGVYIHAGADPEEFLLAFALPGLMPEIWAVVMDKYGNAVTNKSIAFATTGGTLSLAGGTTNYGGFVVSQATTAIGYGNTITVSAPGLPTVTIWPSPGENYSSSDKSFMWFDPTTLLLRHACVEIDKNILTNNAALASANVIVVDNSNNNRTIQKGYVFDQSGTAVPQRIGTNHLCFGTPGVGDVIRANFNTTNDTESHITIQRLNSVFLHAYSEQGTSPNIAAVVTDADGNGLPDYSINFLALTSGGSMQAPPVGGFKTDINGVVKAQYTAASGYYEKIQVTSPEINSAPVEVITYDQNDVQAYYKAIPHYNAYQHKVNVVYVHEYFNDTPNNPFSVETVTTIDQTANQKNLAVGSISNQTSNTPAQAYVSFGTAALGDQISINDTTAEGSPDALISLKPDVEKYLFIYGTGGPTPTTITAVVVDKNGNGLYNQLITFTPNVIGSVSAESTSTNAAGMAYTILNSPGTQVTVAAPNSVSYTAVVQVNTAQPVATNSRVYAWYSILERRVRAAIVSLSNNIMTATGTIGFTPQDTTPNGRTLSLVNPVQQSGINPAQVDVANGSQGEGDMIILAEGTTSADPDSILTITVPTAEIVSILQAMPNQVSVGQYMHVTMTVFNNGSPDALSVSPTALSIPGNLSLIAGPTPGFWAVIPGGTYRQFSWTYQPGSADYNAAFQGNAFGVDSFSMAGVTSTATTSNTVIVQTPPVLACTLSGPDNAERLREFTLSMVVQNNGQAMAVSVTPVNLAITAESTANTLSTQGPSPASANIPGGGSQTFTWVPNAGDRVGNLWFSGQVQGTDANSGSAVTSASALSNTINVIQGALNLDQVSSPFGEVYRGQKGLTVTLHARNTSLMPVTLTASTLTFNTVQQGFVVLPSPGNPTLAAPQSSFELNFSVEITADAALGATVINGTISGDAETGAMSANGAQQTISWQILEAFNALRQNYPNPLRLSQHAFTTLDYFVQEDIAVSIKVYNLAGELVAVLFDGKPGIGKHSVQWFGDNGSPGQKGKAVGSGVYIAVYTCGEYKEMKKVVVIR